jgi:hypothetical protein
MGWNLKKWGVISGEAIMLDAQNNNQEIFK